jgi:hypothetical protein
LTEINACKGAGRLCSAQYLRGRDAFGALMVIGVATSVFQLYGVALVVGCMLMVMSLTDGPRGFKMLARDVKRHVVGR